MWRRLNVALVKVAVVCGLPIVMLGACSHDVALLTAPQLKVRQAPMVAGNTYDRQNALAIIHPAAERINISYEFELFEQTSITAAGLFSGPAWLYRERQLSIPSRFVMLHLSKSDGDYEAPRGEAIRLGQRRFYANDYCLADWQKTDEFPAIKPYLLAVKDSGFALSKDIYVRQYIPREEDSDGRRTNIILIRDIMRKGYDCDRLNNFQGGQSSTEDEIIKGFKEEASSSFEVMG